MATITIYWYDTDTAQKVSGVKCHWLCRFCHAVYRSPMNHRCRKNAPCHLWTPTKPESEAREA